MSWFAQNKPAGAGSTTVQPQRQTEPTDTGGGNAAYGGLTGGELARNPQYIDDQITAGFQQRYGRPPNDQELQQWRGYAGGDTYSDGQYRSGWNPYLQDRLVNPNSAGGSSVNAGTDTIVPGGGPNSGGMGGGGGWQPSGTLGQFTGGGQYPLASYQGQGLLAPWTSAWQAPQLDNSTDPGYQARFNLGKEGMEASAAARGTLLTGGFQKDLNQFAQDYASNEYDKIYGRRRNEYLDAYNIYRGNANDQFGRLSGMANLGLSATNQLNNAGTSYSNNATDLVTGMANANANATKAGSNAYQGALSNLGDTAATLGAYWGTGGPSGSQTSIQAPHIPATTPPYIDPARYNQGEK